MTISIPADGYISDSTRINGEIKTALEQHNTALGVLDDNTDQNTSDITAMESDVNDNTTNISTHTSDNTIHVTTAEKTKLTYGVFFIATQVDFDTYFNGDTISDRNIYLVDIGTPFLLNNNIPFGSNLIIDSDPGVFVQRNGQFRFNSTGTVGTPIYNVTFTDNWTFDGQGGIDTSLPNSGGAITFTGSGGFVLLSYNIRCNFYTKATNCSVSISGGAYYDTAGSTENIFRNIFSNEAASTGGGLYNCDYSTISNVHDNIALSGGGMSNCDYSTINDVFNNIVTTIGGGLNLCNDCTITNVYDNTALSGAGLADCDDCTITNVYDNTATGTGTSNGGGLADCDNCTITNVRSNTASDDGGGLADCDNCTITNVHHNSSSITGGGVYNCNNGTIKDVYLNASNSGGGASICDNVVFQGQWHGNTAAASNEYMNNCASSLAFCLGDGTDEQVVITRATINWN